MSGEAVWVRRMVHLNILQLIVNSGLAFVLLLWFIGLPGGDGTQPQWVEPAAPVMPAVASLPAGDPPAGDAPPAASSAAPSGEVWEGVDEPSGGDAGRPPPGSGAPSGAPGLPPTPVSDYLTGAIAQLRAKADGRDVTAYLPTAEELMGAAATGDFFNPKTLAVLRKLKKGFEAVGGTMPALPEEGPPE